MKRLVIGVAVVAATIVAPGLARPASAAITLCNQCHEQAVINAIRCMSSGPFWLC